MYSVTESATILDLHADTLRAWTKPNKYGGFLSDQATRRTGAKSRSFTPLDLRILAHVKALADAGLRHDEIPGRLKGLKAGEWAELPKIELPGNAEMVTAADAQDAVRATAIALELRHMTQERDQAVMKLTNLESELEAARAARQQDADQIHKLELDLERTKGQVATLQATIDAQRPVRDPVILITRAIIATTVAVVILLIVAIVLLRLLG